MVNDITMKLSRIQVTHGAITILGRESMKDIALKIAGGTSPLCIFGRQSLTDGPQVSLATRLPRNHQSSPKVWAAKIIWYTAVWIQWWSVKPIELWPLASVFVERPCKWVIFHNLWASSGCEPVTCNLVFVFYASLCWRWSNSSIAPTRAISMHWIDLSRQNFSSLLCITPEVQDVTT